MAKKKQAVAEPEVAPVAAPFVLRVEDEGVAPYLEIPLMGDPGRAHTVDLVASLGRFHHVGEGPEGVWIYRRVPA